MSFHAPKGTRGTRQPKANKFFTLMNAWAMRQIRRKGGRVMGMDALVLTTIGAKSGLERTNPVAWFDGGDGTWLICASAAGAAGNPAWFHNVAALPAQVHIDLGQGPIPVVARQLHGPGRETAWRQISRASDRFAGYQTKTDREMPVIRLSRKS